jgi:predicted phage tail component-like protein
MNYVTWKEQDSRFIRGLVICELPPITKPQMRVVETVVDGVDGSRIEELGYATYDKTLMVGITQQADINEVIKFFSGTGDVVFGNEPDKYYKATIINQIDYARLVRFRTATVVFRVQPYKYKLNESEVKIPADNGAYYVTNAGTETSKPLIHISGGGTVECTVNGDTLFQYTFNGDDTDVYIDSELQDAYVGSVLKNRNMMGEFPILQVGSNEITFEGTVTAVEILARSRWL